MRCLGKENGAARCEQHCPRSETHGAPAGAQRICNLLVCGDRFGFMFVSIVHLVETDTAVLLHLQENNCEFAVIRKIREVRNVHTIGKISKFATQIHCTANMQAEPQTVQERVKKACLCVGGLVPKNIIETATRKENKHRQAHLTVSMFCLDSYCTPRTSKRLQNVAAARCIFPDEREWKETFTIEEIQTATLAVSASQACITR